jgi:hypothetical protein
MGQVSCREQAPVQHPTMDYPGPDILVFTASPRPGSGATATNTVVMSNGELDWERPETCSAMLDRQALAIPGVGLHDPAGPRVAQALPR